MNHFVVTLSVCSGILGVSAWTLILQYYRRFSLVAIKRYLYYLGFEVGFVLFTIGYFYVWMNVFSIPEAVRTVVSLVSPLAGLASVFFFIEFSQLFIKKKKWKRLRNAALSLSIIVATTRIMAAITGNLPELPWLQLLASERVFTSLLLLLQLSVNILIIDEALKQKKANEKKAILLFSLAHFSLVLLWMVLLVLRWFSVIDRTVFLSSQYVISSLFYLVLLLFAGRFIVNYLVASSAEDSRQQLMEELVLRYSISPREKEILELICQGKTNQEIADALFIALSTVKEHVTHIYKKTGVSNRVGLTNLFTQPK